MKASQALEKFAAAGFLKGTFAEHFYRNVKVASEGGEVLSFKYTLLPFILGPHYGLSAGGMNTIIDAATTVHLVEKTPKKTISISLAGRYFMANHIDGQELTIETEISKMGKDICFTRAKGLLKGYLIFQGDHVKKVLDADWEF